VDVFRKEFSDSSSAMLPNISRSSFAGQEKQIFHDGDFVTNHYYTYRKGLTLKFAHATYRDCSLYELRKKNPMIWKKNTVQ
jgi:hypothetical protein